MWKIILEGKYAMPQSTERKLKIQNTPKGSEIWNLVASNKDFIRDHNFLEIRGGSTSRFLEYSWKKTERFFNIIDLVEIFLFTNRRNKKIVAQYWDEGTDHQWIKWKQKGHWQNASNTHQWENYENELKSRKLPTAAGDDILRWGYRTKWMFTIQEGYNIENNNIQPQASHLWRKIWSTNHCSKLNTSYG